MKRTQFHLRWWLGYPDAELTYSQPLTHQAPTSRHHLVHPPTFPSLQFPDSFEPDAFLAHLHETIVGEALGAFGYNQREFKSYQEECHVAGQDPILPSSSIIGLNRAYPLGPGTYMQLEPQELRDEVFR